MRTTMQKTVLACLLLGVTGLAAADVPAGPDAINGAFARLLEHPPAALTAAEARGATADAWIAAWANAVARGDADAGWAGFAHLLARRDDVPARLPLAGEPDPVATLVRESLQSQANGAVAYAAL